MGATPIGDVREVEYIICDICKERSAIPPGGWYRDSSYCPHHLRRVMKSDFTSEVVEPHLQNAREDLEDWFENMDPSKEGSQ